MVNRIIPNKRSNRFDKNHTNFIYGLLPNENQKIALFISLIQIRSIIEYKFDILGIIFQVLQILRHRYKKEYRTIIFYEYFSFGRLRKNYLITKEENIILDFYLFSNYTNNDDLYQNVLIFIYHAITFIILQTIIEF